MSGLASIVLPAALEMVGQGSFTFSSYLRSITVERNSVLKPVSDFGFSSTAITSMYLPASVESVGDRSWYACFSLKWLDFGCSNQPVTVGIDALYGSGLTDSTISKCPTSQLLLLTSQPTPQPILQPTLAPGETGQPTAQPCGMPTSQSSSEPTQLQTCFSTTSAPL